MMTRGERNRWLRQHHYRWQQIKGAWILLGPDGWRATEQEAEQAILQRAAHPSPAQWARDIIRRRPLILDSETTGLDPARDEIIELALVELDGSVVLNTLIQCQGVIPEDATAVHGITHEMLRGQPGFPEVWQQLQPYFSRPLVIYNAAYDIPMLAYGALRYRLRMSRPDAHCLMCQYTEYRVGSEGSYQRLEVACRDFGIEKSTHRALADAQATRHVLLCLAAAEEEEAVTAGEER
ncbi:3'-5' exonuclease [Ktedonosporobacter rubrisoli]|uniref:3'-5' exonuclease n=1 Tax=Ktedonosporobacter rubrisoli TaxID=2509675 RepID=A0A4P6K3K6_KTERU|nr:3'-5' exonuclease [Ktedonosporobacter rubrisoli]QBD82847.1 3'-5' exonuclease [Ktedonosporobacter rubrisoli]